MAGLISTGGLLAALPGAGTAAPPVLSEVLISIAPGCTMRRVVALLVAS